MDKILHETANLYLFAGKGLEIRLNCVSHSVLVGLSPSVEKAKITMERLERDIKQLYRFHDEIVPPWVS
jgi:hypothetical protein